MSTNFLLPVQAPLLPLLPRKIPTLLMHQTLLMHRLHQLLQLLQARQLLPTLPTLRLHLLLRLLRAVQALYNQSM